MRRQCPRCGRGLTVKDIADKAEAMRLYARQAKDPEMKIWLAQITRLAIRNSGTITLARDLKSSEA